MKKISLLIITFTLLLSGCQDKQYQKYMANVPVYTDMETFRSSLNSVKFESAKSITEKGNIYFKDDYLFIIDNFKGIHIIDNSNVTSPSKIGYYSISGITGMVVKNNYLYVNSYVDMVVVDISNITSPIEVGRAENAFTYALPEHDPNYPIAEIDQNKGVITDWIVEEYKSESAPINGCFNCEFFANDIALASTSSSSSSSSSPSQGISGSITKFSLINDYLYVMDGNALKPFDLSDPTAPKNTNAVNIWRNVETLFAYNEHIFMGTTTGMLIYNTSNPNAPAETGIIDHTTSCDPVVVDGDYAYVTLRTGNFCSGTDNQLDIIDVSNYSNPTLIQTYNLNNPHGLGIINNTLFICDGDAGLKVYDATLPAESGNNLIKKFSNIQATDIILFNDIAMLIGSDGIYQYDISNVEDIKEISKILFN